MIDQQPQGESIHIGSTPTPQGPQPVQAGGDSDFADNPNYQAPLANNGANPSATSADSDFVDNPNYQAPKTADPTTMNDSDSLGTKVFKAGVGTLKGIGEGMFSTAAGGYDVAGKAQDLQDRVLNAIGLSDPRTPEDKAKGDALKKTVSNWLHNEAGENEASSTSTKIGYGGETLMEFLLGDEALKGLPLAKKLETAAKAMKTIEGSPRMAQALQIGARVLAKTALHGTEAGITQGAQTLVRSGGDVDEAAKQGGEMGATSAVLGAGTGALGEAAQAAGKLPVVADNLSKLSDAAKNAISEQGVFAPLGRAIAASKSAIDDIFNKTPLKVSPEEKTSDMRKISHWSRSPEDITATDPNKAGTGVRGAERDRPQVKGTYFGEDGYKEPMVQGNARKYTASVDYNKIYDLEKDPSNLRQQASDLTKTNGKPVLTNLEQTIKDQGYDGYRNQRVVKMYNPVSVVPDYNLSEVPKGKEGDFAKAIEDAKEAYENSADPTHKGVSAQLTAYDPQDYKNMRLFMSPDKKAGFALDGDNIVSVFSHPTDTPRAAANLLETAVKNGGRRLDAFDTFLPRVYAKQGFKVVARLPFNPDYAPKGWDYDAMRQYNGGKPDVVFMVKDPNASAYVPGTGTKVASYAEGEAAQQRALSKRPQDAASAQFTMEQAPEAQAQAASKADAARSDITQEHAQSRQNLAEQVANREGAAEDTKQATIKTTNDALEKARQVVKNKLLDNLEKVSADAPSPEEVAPALSDAIVKYNKSAQEAYEKGINGEQGIATQLKGQTIPYAGSKSSAAALEGLNTPNPEDDPVTKLAKDVSGDKIDAKTKALLQTVADGKEADITEGTGKNAKVTPGKPLPDRDIDTLVKQRQAVRAAAFGYTSGDINQRVLLKLRDAIDDDIETLANNSNKPEVVQQYQDLKSNYRQQRQLLDSNAAEKLNLKSPDQALDDATKYLTSGTNSAAKVAAITKIAGPETMADLAKVRIQQFKTAAELNPTKFIADWSKVSAPMRNNFFGPELAKKVDDAVETYKQTSQYAEDQASKALEGADIARQAAGAANKTNSALFGKALDADKDTQLKAVSDKYDSTVQSIQDQLDQAKATHTEALSPYSTSFVRNLADGRVSDQLLKGTVDLQDVKNVKQVVGDKWPDIANGLFQRGIADNEGNPEKILDWWNEMKPDVRAEIFSNSPEAEAAYNKAIETIKDTAAGKQLLKNLVLRPVAYTGAATPGIVLGSAIGTALKNPIVTPMMELMGAAASAGLGGGTGMVNKLVDYVADHPNTWKILGKVGSVASKVAPVLQSDILPNVAAKGAVSGVNEIAKRREQQRKMLAGAQSTLSQ